MPSHFLKGLSKPQAHYVPWEPNVNALSNGKALQMVLQLCIPPSLLPHGTAPLFFFPHFSSSHPLFGKHKESLWLKNKQIWK